MVTTEELGRQIEFEKKKVEFERKKWELMRTKIDNKVKGVKKNIELRGQLFALKNRRAFSIGRIIGKTSKTISIGLFKAGKATAKITANAIDALDEMEKRQIAIERKRRQSLNKIKKLRERRRTTKTIIRRGRTSSRRTRR